MSSSVPRDIQEFLDNYPGNRDNKRQTANLEFYTNRRRCQPNNLLVSELHEQWKGDYNRLEREHGYIQWLFPIQEHGMNFQAQPLQRHEIETIKADPEAVNTVLGSYRLMLDFYGMQLISDETGLLARVDGVAKDGALKYEKRYDNLISRSHNYLRISRILKSLSEFGLERLNAGFLLHLLNEQSEHQELDESYLKSSMDRWWANCIRNEEERSWIGAMIRKVRREGFVLTRGMYEQALERRKEAGKLSFDEPQASGADEHTEWEPEKKVSQPRRLSSAKRKPYVEIDEEKDEDDEDDTDQLLIGAEDNPNEIYGTQRVFVASEVKSSQRPYVKNSSRNASGNSKKRKLDGDSSVIGRSSSSKLTRKKQ